MFNTCRAFLQSKQIVSDKVFPLLLESFHQIADFIGVGKLYVYKPERDRVFKEKLKGVGEFRFHRWISRHKEGKVMNN